MAFELNRIDGTPTLSSLRPENFSVKAGEAMVELPVAANQEIELYFPALYGNIEAMWLELATDLMTHLTEIDNEVQRISAEQWKANGQDWPSSYYEGDLAYVRLAGPDEAVLRYWVIGCNSEWDERFFRTHGKWVRKA